ncbi:MAG: hypothetical protein JNK48_34320 [Bryobacterales bacterium]|nr:hypothetical protein [Bryobacterales bacterium]
MRLWPALLPFALSAQPLPGTLPLDWTGDSAGLVVSGIHRFLDSYRKPPSSPTRERLAYILGATEPLQRRPMERLGGHRVRWQVLDTLAGEGLLLQPKTKPRLFVVAIPDAGESLESFAAGMPSTLAAAGATVLIPQIVDRADTFSGVPGARQTNMPHREFLWRQLYPLGRHIIGVEVQKVLAAFPENLAVPKAIAGYGEGGLIALHAAALDPSIETVLVSGYFGPRDELWKEPVYRDVWGLLPDYRDASLASLILPRRLIVETAPGPRVDGPPQEEKDKRGAAPHGSLAPFTPQQVEAEIARIHGPAKPIVIPSRSPWSKPAIQALLGLPSLPSKPVRLQFAADPTRLQRQVRNIVDYARRVIRQSPQARAGFWAEADRSSVAAWTASTRQYRDRIWRDLIGRLPDPSIPINPRTRLLYDEPAFRGYEVVLDVWNNVPAYGILLVPRNPNGRLPAVVCQHGLEGRPTDVANPHGGNPIYKQFAVRLAEQGFVTFSPQNPYVLADRFRQINRKAHPWALSQFSFIAGQHQRILEWLGSLPFVDAARIGFYGLSYGGFTAQRIPALLTGYALSINSGNFNEWVWKVASLDAPFVYPLTGEYDIPEFNLAHLANYAELSTLIFPRPFMVERGHRDGVGWDEWVAFEYAKVYRFYSQMGLKNKTIIEYFDGPHEIHGVGTYEFLKKHLMGR